MYAADTDDSINMRVRLRVIGALILRDLMVRFGRSNLGFVWTILEPMILTAGVIVVWSIIRPSIYHGVPIVAFVLTGYMPLTMWRHLTNPANKIFRTNTSLLYHRVISHYEILIARLILEFISTSIALVVVYTTLLALGVLEPVADYSLLLLGWLLTSWYFGAVGLSIAALTEIWEPTEKFIQPAQYLSLPVSGVFFMVDWMPDFGQKLLLLNPPVHCFEIFRAGFFGPSVNTHYDVGYIVVWCIGLTALGVFALRNVREHIQSL